MNRATAAVRGSRSAPARDAETVLGCITGALQVQGNETLRRKAVNILREAILTAHFRPGQRLVERDLCEQTGVSRSSIREALRYLEAEGLAESRGTKGIFVATLSAEDAGQIYEVRAALESEAARHFADRASPADVSDLRSAFEDAARKVAADLDGYRRATDRFIEVLFRGAGNAVAEALANSLNTRIRLLRATTTRLAPLARRKGSVRKMERILIALERRDGTKAAVAAREFVERSARFAAESLARGADPADGR